MPSSEFTRPGAARHFVDGWRGTGMELTAANILTSFPVNTGRRRRRDHVPRYRFQWESLPPSLLKALCDELGLSPENTPDALRQAFGPRPQEDFIQAAWPTLLQGWLSTDDDARQQILKTLRARDLGSPQAPRDSPEDEIAYLRSCGDSTALRQAVLARFLAAGEDPSPALDAPPPMMPAGVPGGKPGAAGPGDRQPPVHPEPGRLVQWVERTLVKALGVERLERDEAGDFPFRFGSSLSFVRVIEEDPPRIEIFAPIVRDLERTPGLLEGLNEINLKLRFARVVLTPANEVVLGVELPAWTVIEQELLFMLNLVLRAADEFDGKIRQRFGGRKMFTEEGETVDV